MMEKKRISSKKLKVYGYLTLALICSILLFLSINLYIVYSTNSLVYTNSKDIPQKDFCLLLGARPGSYAMDFRISATLELYKAGKVKHILVSGDNGIDSYNEPKDISRELIRNGIPKENITLDYAGFRTLDSVYRAQHVFDIDELIIVTQEFHANRALYLAQKHSINSLAFIAKPTISREFNQFRECFARVRAFLDISLGVKPKFPGPPEPITQFSSFYK